MDFNQHITMYHCPNQNTEHCHLPEGFFMLLPGRLLLSPLEITDLLSVAGGYVCLF